MKSETLAAQALHAIDAATGAIVPPIHLATTFARDEHYAPMGPVYARDESPAPLHAERVIAALEGGAAAMVFSSGMAAATAAIRALLRPGDHVIAPRVGYFALRHWLERFAARWGVGLDIVDTTDLAAVQAALRPGVTKLVWVETPANPTWELTDLSAVADLAHRAGARLAVDSTTATPVHTRPLEHGADLVMHSATKYLGGHSDVLAGALVTRVIDDAWTELAQLRHDEGPCIGPMEAYLLLRGMRTLYARVERSSRTAQLLADQLAALPGVTVRYPGLASHPQHALARRQMERGFGSMLSIQVGGGAERALSVVKRLRVWVPATSLGGVESLVEHRFSVEGANTPTPPDLLRLSVGLEHEDDLLEDLRQALETR
ncbi:MAG: aminotransferase class I/II-fold pyridoxal phosphate-dependent enzyme [Deltaproteobacteria bacterium]|nr:aminotransferase class I/II-fold pyridoxal phosphate-dependent enzyme [Deltaproteobacteria bacterium]